MEPKFPVRKTTRLKSHDYSGPGFYFVTICTKTREENVLSAIISPRNAACAVGAAALGGPCSGGARGGPKVALTDAGEAVARHIKNIDRVYHGQITVDHYVIMPDHVHLLIQICPLRNGPPRAAAPTATLSHVINALKGLTTKALGYSLWQRGFYDHVIRNNDDLSRVREYIDTNPVNWILSEDRL